MPNNVSIEHNAVSNFDTFSIEINIYGKCTPKNDFVYF